MTTIETTKTYQVGQEVHNEIVEVNGQWNAAFVRVTRIVSQETIERPGWMDADSAGGKQYPLTKTTYSVDVIQSRPSGVPAYSDQLGQHLASE